MPGSKIPSKTSGESYFLLLTFRVVHILVYTNSIHSKPKLCHPLHCQIVWPENLFSLVLRAMAAASFSVTGAVQLSQGSGKLRRVAKRPASKKCLEYKSVKYVRGERDLPPAGVRLDRVHWKRTVPELLKATDRQIVQILQQDKMLPKWHGKVCPHCQRGHLQEKLRYGKPHYRCRAKGCQRYVSPQYLHPFFTSCLGPQATSLQLQSATLFMLLTGCSFPQVHLALGINHKAIEDMFACIATARQAYVVEKQKSIVFGHEKSWVDVEADEATFQRTNVSKDVEYKDSAQTGKPILWEQWSGIMVRGKPSTLLLSRLAPPLTKSRAPGPGAIRKVDWQPLATKHLLNSHVVLHTDSAKSYKARVKGVLHDAVVHCKKKTLSPCGKKTQWRSPQYVRVVNHKLPNGKTLKVKAGTQHIDRAWRFLKDRLHVNQNVRAGSKALCARIRSAQYEYWMRGHDLWSKTGELVQHLLKGFVQK